MTYFEALKKARQLINQRALDPNVADYLMRRRLKWSGVKLLMNYQRSLSKERFARYRRDVNQYLAGWPPQYIIGTAPFYGYNFRVDPRVLIPRPETEGLVHWLLNDTQQARRTQVGLDLGTGSGAIAIALKLQRPGWQILATDVSGAALAVAKTNARFHRAEINFKRSDLFTGLPKHHFDFIISNPPYVSMDEVKDMDASVFNYEPHLALFARDHGLLMYKRIANAYLKYLKPHGRLYLEMGFRQKSSVCRIFRSRKVNLQVKRDLAGYFRMLRVSRI